MQQGFHDKLASAKCNNEWQQQNKTTPCCWMCILSDLSPLQKVMTNQIWFLAYTVWNGFLWKHLMFSHTLSDTHITTWQSDSLTVSVRVPSAFSAFKQSQESWWQLNICIILLNRASVRERFQLIYGNKILRTWRKYRQNPFPPAFRLWRSSCWWIQCCAGNLKQFDCANKQIISYKKWYLFTY